MCVRLIQWKCMTAKAEQKNSPGCKIPHEFLAEQKNYYIIPFYVRLQIYAYDIFPEYNMEIVRVLQ